MNINIIEDSILSGLADKIREKLGVADTFLPSAMPGKIGEISAGEGVYAWKKGNREVIWSYTNPGLRVTLELNTDRIKILIDSERWGSDQVPDDYITADTYIDIFDGFYRDNVGGNRLKFVKNSNGELTYVCGSYSGIVAWGEATDPTKHVGELILNGFSFPTGTGCSLSYDGTKQILDVEFVSYVVSNDETEYPENGIHTDGYTYERIKKKILMYVWHKYQKKSTSISGKVNVAINMIVNGSGGSCTITTTNGLDPSKITDSTFYGAELYYADPSSSIFDMKIILNSDHTTTHYIKSSSNNYAWQATPPNGNNIWDLNGTTLIVAISAGINSAYTFTYSKTVTQTTTVNSFMEEVMSENRNAYPDSISIKHTDGYYYEYKEERVVES